MLTHLQTPRAPARVVILGAKGFIAAALARELTSAHIPHRAVSSSELDLSAPAASAALATALAPADAVVVAAALTPERGRDVATLAKNLRMAETVCAALAARPVAHLVYLSSDAVYDWRSPLITEQTAPSPTDLYSTMHLAREQMLAAAATAASVPFAVVRPCAVYGPGDTHNSYGPNRFARTASTDGKIALFGEGEEKRDHVFIADVVALLRATLERRSTGTLNAVSGRSASFREVAEAIAARLPRPVTIETSARRSTVTHRHFDATALWRAFPTHVPTPLASGLAALLGTR